jgi:protein-tyrosine-phosphatase
MLPSRLVDELRRVRSLDPGARRTYLRRFAGRSRAASENAALPELRRARRILFVCHGNIMRSALAEGLVRRELAALGASTIAVRSAGLHAIPDSPADPRMVHAAARVGLDLVSHRATLISESLMADSDLVFVMDYLNDAEIRARFPNHVRKVWMLGAAAPTPAHGLEIPDPFSEGESAVNEAVERIRKAIGRLIGA